ncbi:MAG TPA: N-acetylmuramoyl-L-alanine amidase [bacterium]|nr:N-acetylmuramoyl-L-alanine amidase [bacterium]HPN31481.1 N-acetylmuramoyl-L-alanine amidase [bacterium]
MKISKNFIISNIILIIFAVSIFCSNAGAAVVSYVSYSMVNSADLSDIKIPAIQFNKTKYLNLNDITRIMNLKYIWEPFTLTLELTDNKVLLKMQMNSNLAMVNEKVIQSENGLMNVDGGIYLPAEILEFFNQSVIKLESGALYYKKIDNSVKFEDDIAKTILAIGQIKMPEVKKKRDGFNIKTIAVDPGHGGVDAGAVSYSKRVLEKDITLAVALKLKEYIEKSGKDVNVLLTRSSDETLFLDERPQIANKNKCDLFLSIHCNSGPKNAQGFETFYFSLTEDDETERTARLLENNIGDSYKNAKRKMNPIDFITTDLAQINHINESSDFAEIIQKKLFEAAVSSNRGVKKARFMVLKDAFMPSVLVELGFLSNETEEKLLTNENYQNKLAAGIGEAILQYKQKSESVKSQLLKN